MRLLSIAALTLPGGGGFLLPAPGAAYWSPVLSDLFREATFLKWGCGPSVDGAGENRSGTRRTIRQTENAARYRIGEHRGDLLSPT
jgi:hypothetical protein